MKMPDRKKVIKGLQCCSVKGMNTCELQECPYYPERYEWNRCTNHLATDALAMLKEQEPQSVIVKCEPSNGNILWFANCPKCGRGIERDKHKNHCGYCGLAVKWDEGDAGVGGLMPAT